MPVEPWPKDKRPEARTSMDNTLNAAYQTKKAATRMWSTAATCPLFLKEANKKPYIMKNGRKSPKFRGNRALSTHTIKALASGAAANASAHLQKEAALLRCDTATEAASFPMLPCVTRSAAMLFESAVIAYAQTIFAESRDLKNAFRKAPKRISVRGTQAAADAVNQRLAQATSFVPPSIHARSRKAKQTKATADKAADGAAETAPVAA